MNVLGGAAYKCFAIKNMPVALFLMLLNTILGLLLVGECSLQHLSYITLLFPSVDVIGGELCINALNPLKMEICRSIFTFLCT